MNLCDMMNRACPIDDVAKIVCHTQWLKDPPILTRRRIGVSQTELLQVSLYVDQAAGGQYRAELLENACFGLAIYWSFHV